MALTHILQWLGKILLLCAGLMFVTAAISLGLRETHSAIIFIQMGGVAGIVAALFYFSTQHVKAHETGRDALLFLLAFWIVVPIVTALPFSAFGVSANFTQAYFESVSAITTTGAASIAPEVMPDGLLIWRALLQWCGGVVVATFAVVILAALNLTGSGVHRSMLFTLSKGDLFPRLIKIGRIIAAIYASISAMCCLLLMITGASFIDAICLSLSAVSTGGLMPQSQPMAGYINHLGAATLALTCLLGAFNVAILYDVVRIRSLRGIRQLLRNEEHRGTIAVCVILFLIGLYYAGQLSLFTVAVESVFVATTTGFDYHVIGLDVVPTTVLIMAALVGGSALSTAGGIKIIRILLLGRHLTTDLGRLSHPSRVKVVKFRGQSIPDKEFLSVWMYFFGYTLFFAIGVLALAAAGLTFEYAVSAAAGGLSNMGPLLPMTFPETGYQDFNSLQLFLMTIIMLAGRVEVLAAFAAISPSLWQR